MPAGQRGPREQHPWPHGARPVRVGAPLDQRRGGEGESDREADIADIEQRRMEDEAGVLQQRVEPAAVGGHREQPLERVRGEDDEGEEQRADAALDAEDAGTQRFADAVVGHRDQAAEDREDQHPQQHRPFVVAPRRAEPVDQRLRRMAVLGDEREREIGAGEPRHQAAERQDDERRRGRRRRVRPNAISAGSPRDAPYSGHGELEDRDRKREQEREMSDFGRHGSRNA